VHSDIQEVCGSSRILTALVLLYINAEVYWCTVEHNCSIDFLLDAKHLRAVETSTFIECIESTNSLLPQRKAV